MEYIRKHYPALLIIIIAVIIWEALVRITETPVWILPSPSQIAVAFADNNKIIFYHALITLAESLLGFTLAIIFAILLAILIDNIQFLKKGFYPILVASQTIPIIAIAPLLTIWFGFGILPKIFVVVLVAFFPIVVSLIDGLNSTDQGLISLLETMNASKWQIFFKIRFPSALPSFFSGLRIAATYSVMGAVIMEWLGASKGLGNYMKNTSHSFQTAQNFAAVIVVIGVSILLYSLLMLLESKIIPWNKKNN